MPDAAANDKPLVSIIVPVYNVEKYLQECLESLIHQTLKEIEIIIVNDGSPDRSLEICERYAQQDTRIHVYSKENGGLSDARNYGIDRAAAPFIGFVDSDDYVDLNMFEYLFQRIQQEDADISVCESRVFDEYTILPPRGIPGEMVLDRHEAMKELLYGCRLANAVWNKLFKRSLFKGIRFPVGKLYEDEFVTYKLFDRADRIAIGNKAVYYYRNTVGSITHRAFSDRELDRVVASLEKCDFCKEKYPDLLRYAERYLVYDCCSVLSKMEKYDHKYDGLVVDNIRRHLRTYLFEKSSNKGRFFAVVAAVNPFLAVHLYRRMQTKS